MEKYQECPDYRPDGPKDRRKSSSLLRRATQGTQWTPEQGQIVLNGTIVPPTLLYEQCIDLVRVRREDKRGGRGRQTLTRTKVVAIPLP